MRNCFRLLLAALCVLVPLSLEAWQHPIALIRQDSPDRERSFVVNKIEIEALDAFDPRIPTYRSWPFRFLNKLHNRTNDSFIRRELLFSEGDRIDNDLIAESERSLRSHDFLGDVWIEEQVVGPGRADLRVHTEDQWTLEFDISAGKSSGFSTYHFSVTESNFLGLGKTLGLAFEKDPERDTYGILYSDPQFLNSRWNFQSDYRKNSDGWQFINQVVRPFYSLDTRWAYGVAWDSGVSSKPLYARGGKAVAEIDTEHRNAVFFAARSWGPRYDKRRFGLLFNADSLAYPHPARIIFPEDASVKMIKKNLHPLNRESYQYGAMFEWDRQRFIEERFIDHFGKIEDLPVGLRVHSYITHSENTSDTPDYFELRGIVEYNKQVSSWQYFSLSSDFSGRRETNGTINNVVFTGYAHYYLKLPEIGLAGLRFPRQTLAAGITTTLTKDVEAPFQLTLGENEGLRGYTFKEFVGQNRLLLNVEDRIFTPINYRLLGIGLVAFADVGYVWSSEDLIRFNDFGISAGIGLRLALKKSQTSRVIRIDFAVPLKNNTSNFTRAEPKGYSISISSGQIFSVLGELPKLFQLF